MTETYRGNHSRGVFCVYLTLVVLVVDRTVCVLDSGGNVLMLCKSGLWGMGVKITHEQ
jgi:hypothetical protein